MFFLISLQDDHFVRLPGAISGDSPVLNDVQQGTILGPLFFLIMLADINKDISESNLISFADDTWIYSKIDDVTDYNTLQQDLNHVYDWASANNMFFNAQKFYYVSFSPNKYSSLSNVYINPEYNIISPSSNVLDLGVYMSSNCTFDFHVANVYKRCFNWSPAVLAPYHSGPYILYTKSRGAMSHPIPIIIIIFIRINNYMYMVLIKHYAQPFVSLHKVGI